MDDESSSVLVVEVVTARVAKGRHDQVANDMVVCATNQSRRLVVVLVVVAVAVVVLTSPVSAMSTTPNGLHDDGSIQDKACTLTTTIPKRNSSGTTKRDCRIILQSRG